MENKFKIEVVIGSWKAYNECNERGLGSKRLDLTYYDSLDELIEELKKEGFKDDELEETFIQDIESDGIEFDHCDYITLQELFSIVETLDSVDDYNINLVKALAEVESLDAIIERIKDGTLDSCYLYEDCDTLSDYAEMIVDSCYNISDDIKRYIDYESMGEDMSINQCLYETNYGVLEIN